MVVADGRPAPSPGRASRSGRRVRSLLRPLAPGPDRAADPSGTCSRPPATWSASMRTSAAAKLERDTSVPFPSWPLGSARWSRGGTGLGAGRRQTRSREGRRRGADGMVRRVTEVGLTMTTPSSRGASPWAQQHHTTTGTGLGVLSCVSCAVVTDPRPPIGILALQGDVREHAQALEQAGAHRCRCAGPTSSQGWRDRPARGESTTIDKLLRAFDLSARCSRPCAPVCRPTGRAPG